MRGRVLKTSVRLQAGSAAIAIAGLTAVPMAVADIDVTPRLQVRQTWTDTSNLDQRLPNNGDFITTISPGVDVSGATPRVQTSINYTLNGLVFWRNSSQSDIRHNLNAAINTEVLEDRFFVNARGSVNQQFQNFGGQISNFNANFTQNRVTVQNYSVTPRWRERLGTFANAELSYTYGLIKQGGNPLTDNAIGVGFLANATSHRGNFSLRDADDSDKLGWTWNSTYQSIDRSGIRNFDFESYESILDLSYELSRKVTLLSSIGYEDIRDDTLLVAQTGSVWDVGMRWRPGPRSTIEGRVGRRFNDTVFSALARYSFSDSDQIEATYSEDIAVANRNSFLLVNRQARIDNNNVPILPGFNDEVFDSESFLTDAAFRQQRAALSLIRQLRKTTLSSQAFWSKRIFEGNAINSSYGITLSGVYRIDAAQSVSMQGTFRHTQFGPVFQDDFLGLTPSYTYAFSPNLNAAASYNYTKRFSDVPGLPLSTNSISLSLTALF